MAVAAGVQRRASALRVRAAGATGHAGDALALRAAVEAAGGMALGAAEGPAGRPRRRRAFSLVLGSAAALAAVGRGRGRQPQPAGRAAAHALEFANAAPRGVAIAK